MESYIDLSGQWEFYAQGQKENSILLPNTLDNNQIGNSDMSNLTSRLTRLYTYEGEAHFITWVKLPLQDGRLFLEAQRTRVLRLKVNETEIKACVLGTLSTPSVFELTAFIGQTVKLELISDNRYDNLPRKSILNSSAATNETQTNWNGILGYLRIRKENQVFIEAIRVYPHKTFVDIEIDLNGIKDFSVINQGKYQLELCCSAFLQEIHCFCEKQWKEKKESLTAKIQQISSTSEQRMTLLFSNIVLKENIKYWEEEEGHLYELKVIFKQYKKDTSLPIVQEKTISFGIREFGFNEEKRLTLNHRVFFLRGETNCCVFPEEGHPPMTKAKWKQVLEQYACYGVNYVRFHSWCPPEEAFLAADELGIMLQPELSQWNCQDAFQEEGSIFYYELELYSILSFFCNHPSFVMLTFGNELQTGKEGHKQMDRLLLEAKKLDPTRLYANSSNYHYGEEGEDEYSDFYTSSNYYKEMLRATNAALIGHINHEYPSACHNYNKVVDMIRKKGKPVFGFEVGQYEILPDLNEIEMFQGVTRAVNLEIVEKNRNQVGLSNEWDQYSRATGELSFICYREEVEAVLRTFGMSGLCLLGLQDFPGQGTALVGMLNSHLIPKPYEFAKPERFHRFFNSVVVLLFLPRYTYTVRETLQAKIKVANYGKTKLKEEASIRILEKETLIYEKHFPKAEYPNGGLFDIGVLEFHFAPEQIGFIGRQYQIEICLGNYINEYPIWVYPEYVNVNNPNVKICSSLSKELLEEILQGSVVFFEPNLSKDTLPQSVEGHFSTDFWSVGTFSFQEGTMGLVIDTKHPIFDSFPTQFHSNWQWWSSQTGSRPLLLPKHIHAVITVADSCTRLRHMGVLLEAKVGKGTIMISTMGLQQKQQYPENRALFYSILQYMNSKKFMPTQELSAQELTALLPIF